MVMDIAVAPNGLGEVILNAQEVCRKWGATCEPCGSRVTQCAAVSEDSDYDFLVHLPSGIDPDTKQYEPVDDRLPKFMDELGEAGFEWEGSNEHYQNVAASSFMSWRQGKVNLIVTTNGAFAMRHRAATHVCMMLGDLEKPDRVMVFQACLYGTKWDPVIGRAISPTAAMMGDEIPY